MLAAFNAAAVAGGAEASSSASISSLSSLPAGNGQTAQAPAPFADLIADAVGQVSQLEQQANAAVSGLIAGSGVDVHRAMIATEKANMAFEMALAVRNKAVQAYQSLMGMQF